MTTLNLRVLGSIPRRLTTFTEQFDESPKGRSVADTLTDTLTLAGAVAKFLAPENLTLSDQQPIAVLTPGPATNDSH